MSYSVRMEQFEGPLDLLLQSVESRKLEITTLSLVKVTNAFVEQMRSMEQTFSAEEMSDFLLIAAKLIYLKSKALLPDVMDTVFEDGQDLETQLRLYKIFFEAATRIGEQAKHAHACYSRRRSSMRGDQKEFVPPKMVTQELLQQLFLQMIKRLEPLIALPERAMERLVTIEEKIADLQKRVLKTARVSFHAFLAQAKDRHEQVVSFLALLELIKQRFVTIRQPKLFHDIHISTYDA